MNAETTELDALGIGRFETNATNDFALHFGDVDATLSNPLRDLALRRRLRFGGKSEFAVFLICTSIHLRECSGIGDGRSSKLRFTHVIVSLCVPEVFRTDLEFGSRPSAISTPTTPF